MRPSRRLRFTPPPLRVQAPIQIGLTIAIDVLSYLYYRRYPARWWIVPLAVLITLLSLTLLVGILRLSPPTANHSGHTAPPDHPPDHVAM